MWSKIFLAALGLSIGVMVFFTYYSWSWLQSIGQPAYAAAGYEYHSSIAWPALWVSGAILLMIGNAVLWTGERAWALWATFLYFAVFAVIRYFWLNQSYFYFAKNHGLMEGTFSTAPLFAVILIAFMAIVVFVNQFVVTRLRAKTYPELPAETDSKT